MNIRIPLLATLFGGILTVSTQAQTITAPTGQNLTITNPVDVTGTGNTINIPSDGSYKIGGSTVFRTKTGDNLFVGVNAGPATTGINNVFLGNNAGYNNVAGTLNLFMGTNAGFANTAGTANVFVGYNAGLNNQGGRNVFFGTYAGTSNIGGEDNFFLGYNSGAGNVSGSGNCYLGTQAGNVATGNYNTFVGYASGASNASGSGNTYIGYGANGSNGVVNAVAIGFGATVTQNSSIILGGANNERVGIGNTAPTARLEVTSGVANTSGLKFTNLTSGSAATPVGGNKVLSVDGTGNVVLVTLVGITGGATPPLTGVGINSATSPVAEKTWKDQDGYLYNNSTNGVVINGSGLEGNSLIVKGGILSKEVNVKVEGSESWPDYVFKPSYKRMTLDEVEKFININGHLPNVASATEMAVIGNNLNKTDIKLLEKVEELTLYLLEMKKANEVQNAEIQNLKKQVKSLRRK